MEGLKKGVPKQKSLNMILAVQQKPDEDPYEFLEKIYQAYRKHTDCDPEAPENMQMVASSGNLFCCGKGEGPPQTLFHNKDVASNRTEETVFQEVIECVCKYKDFSCMIQS